MLNFKEFIQGSANFLPSTYTGSETGTDMDKKSPMPGIDLAVKPVEKTGLITRIEYTKNPITIGFTGGDIKIPWDNLRTLLGSGDPLAKLQFGKTITVQYDYDGPNARISGIKIY